MLIYRLKSHLDKGRHLNFIYVFRLQSTEISGKYFEVPDLTTKWRNCYGKN